MVNQAQEHRRSETNDLDGLRDRSVVVRQHDGGHDFVLKVFLHNVPRGSESCQDSQRTSYISTMSCLSFNALNEGDEDEETA